MLRALESPERAHTLLIGPPACAKSLFMLDIEKGMQSEVYFTEGAATTKAGLQKFIAENQQKEIIIIDEIDKMSIQHQEFTYYDGARRVHNYQSQKHTDCKS
jgi:Holliday junction resolvasome RuvABC ATP-dependent DNA helicase subunit